MSGATDALTRLQAECAPSLAAVSVAVRNASGAHGAFRTADDLLPGMGDAVSLILALERLADEAKVAEKAARAAMAACMEEVGAPTIRTEAYTVSVSAARASVQVTDPAAIPAELMSKPEPTPDKTAIGKLLRAGQSVPGAVLSNGGAPVLTIKRSEA